MTDIEELVKRNTRSGVKGVRGFPTAPIAERFWAKVDRRGPDECWPWTGARDSRGYGHISIDGRNRKAARVAWSLHNGLPFPKGLHACHSCDNPNCVNPEHIWPGSNRENVRDAIDKGRRAAKPNNGNSAKTHCPAGHEYSPENTLHTKKGRGCRACQRQWNRECAKRRYWANKGVQ